MSADGSQGSGGRQEGPGMNRGQGLGQEALRSVLRWEHRAGKWHWGGLMSGPWHREPGVARAFPAHPG